MPLLGFDRLEATCYMPVILVMLLNGYPYTVRLGNALRDFMDRSGSGVGRCGRRSPSNVNGRALLSEHRSNALTDASAGSRYNCYFTGEGGKAAHNFEIELAMKLLFVYVLQGQVGEDAGIVDKDVHIAELLLCFAEEAIYMLRRGHASLHRDGLSAGRFDLFNEHDARLLDQRRSS